MKKVNDEPKIKDPSTKLYKVLLEEYEKLGILYQKPDIAKIKAEFDKEFVGLNWKGFQMNEWIQAKKIEIIRKNLLKKQEKSDKPENAELSYDIAENNQIIIKQSPTALCFSGGGIRSATFSLGILQGLAKYGLLDKFDYLSTVSGGGYIGSWLTAWVDRAGSIEKVQSALSRDRTNPYLFELQDFNVNFEDPSSLKVITKIKEKLEFNPDYFTPEIIEKLGKIKLPTDSDKEKITEENYKIKEFLKAFCKTLNQILLKQKVVEENNQYCLVVKETSILSIEKIRTDFEVIFDEFLAKPYLFTREEFIGDFTNEQLLHFVKNSTDSSKKNDFFNFLLNTLENHKYTENEYFQNLFLDELNKDIEKKPNSIEKIKARGRIHKKLRDVFKKHDEFDFLQNPQTANVKVEPEEITHLRTYSNYMSPKLGLFSTDTFSLIALYLRNLFLNWLVFIPIIAAFLLLPKIYLWIAEKKSIFLELEKLFPAFLLNIFKSDQQNIKAFFEGITPISSDYWYLLIIAAIVGIIGIFFINIFRPSLDKETRIKQNYTTDKIGETKTCEGKIKLMCFYPLVLTSIILTLYWKWLEIKPSDIENYIYYFIGFGITLFIISFILARSIFFGWNIFKLKMKNDASAKVYSSSDLWNIGKEVAASLACGIIGGLILYFATERFFYFLNEGTTHFSKIQKQFIDSVYISFAPPIFLLVFLIAATLFIGIASKITDDMDREWMTRFGAMILKFIIAWIVVFCTVLLGDVILEKIFSLPAIAALLASIGSLSGIITLALGFSSSSTEEKSEGGLKDMILSYAPQIAAPIFILFLIGLIAYLTKLLIEHTDINNPWFWFIMFALFGCVLGIWININKFSLHAMYRERLIRAYLGASRVKERFKTANSFTGLDLKDNVEMKYLVHKPFHVVNMTLNLVKTNNLKWQNRKAESFTATALYCGSSNMGNGTGHFRHSGEYGQNQQNKRSITLGTAAAISGAAASPNMGYYTVSSAVSFLMTLFNIRLGWWLGNPGNMGEKTYKEASPWFSPKLLFDEAFGNTTNTYPYIYVSDGGHFENLGIYEMVLRRCKFILAIDGGADGDFSFSDLGNAVHKIRVDMGVPIIFREEPIKGQYCTIADVKYSEVDGEDSGDGVIIYIKPTLNGTEPIDIYQYKSISKDFPHETTGDQMYSETQFESYRSLGFHIIDTICRGVDGKNMKCDDFNQLEILAKNYMKEFENKSKLKKELNVIAKIKT